MINACFCIYIVIITQYTVVLQFNLKVFKKKKLPTLNTSPIKSSKLFIYIKSAVIIYLEFPHFESGSKTLGEIKMSKRMGGKLTKEKK